MVINLNRLFLASFLFFMSFNRVTVLGVNISFLIFIPLIFYFIKNRIYFRPLTFPNIFFIFFGISAIISTIFSENISTSFSVLPNYLYWSILSIFFIYFFSYYAHDDKSQALIFKYLSLGLFITIISYNLPFIDNLPFLSGVSPNGYAFTNICFFPILFTYISKKYNLKIAFIFLIFILVNLLINERRAGLLLIITSVTMIYFFKKINFRFIVYTLFFSIFILMIANTAKFENYIKNSSSRVYSILYDTQKTLETDQSYLFRVAMIEKGTILFQDNILNGVGINNFARTEAELNLDFVGANIIKRKEFNFKSAHNSYILILAEGGLLLFIPFLLILVYNILKIFYNYNSFNEFHKTVSWSFLTMLIHFYFITGILNVFSWIIISYMTGINLSYTSNKKNGFSKSF